MKRYKLLFPVLLLVGCANFAPEYQQPEIPVTNTITGEKNEKIESIELLAWKDFFKDPVAHNMISIALENNKDLHIAAANVLQSQGLYQIQKSEIIPTIGAAGSESVSRNTRELNGNRDISRRYDASIGLISYELDFWGRLRNLNEAALSDFFATIANERNVRLLVISNTAIAYYDWLSSKQKLELAKKTLKARESSLNLTRSRKEAGIASDLDTSQAEVSYMSIAANLENARIALARDLANLNLTVGFPVLDFLDENARIEDQKIILEVPENLSSTVLLNRPDIIAAEERLIAANANIGAARAAFFPRVTLMGSTGYASTELSGLFSGSSRTWSFLPEITIPIFGDSNKANLDVQEALKIREVAMYEKAIQTAFSEVYQSFVAKDAFNKQIKINKKLVKAQRRRLELSEARYNAGLSSYLEVLDSQQELFIAENDLLESYRSEISATILLYRALGGGDDVDQQNSKI